MRLLWFSWKDRTHPLAGGAELVVHELSKRLIADGHEVAMLTASYPGAASRETLDGINIIRIEGNRYAHSLKALLYYLRHLRGHFDMIVETVNTAPYFSVFFKGRARAALLYHQLAREIWFYETRFPLNYIGYYVLEPGATWLLSRAQTIVLAMSESTKQDITRFGFKPENIHVISEGIQLTPVKSLKDIRKFEAQTILSLGALRPMKRTLHQVKAFELAKQQLPELKMKIAGDATSSYGQQVLRYIKQSPYKADIKYLGRVTNKQRLELLQKSHIILQTSTKEGWGLTITEAASQGTPAVVYDVDGLRDSVKHNETGIITAPDESALANGIVQLLSNTKHYEKLRKNAWQWSKEITFDKSYHDFKAGTRL